MALCGFMRSFYQLKDFNETLVEASDEGQRRQTDKGEEQFECFLSELLGSDLVIGLVVQPIQQECHLQMPD